MYQGSPLGPLLFILYINDIVRITGITGEVFCNMYADDTVIVASDNSSSIAIEKSFDALLAVKKWCMLNRINLNKKKTKHMIIGNSNSDVGLNVNGLDAEISKVEHYMYLGVDLDHRLTFEKYINNTVSRVNGRLITFARIRKMVDVYTSVAIYKQTILPILDYMSILVDSSTQRKIKKLQPLQNRAICIVEKRVGYISTLEMNELHKKHKLKLLCERRKVFMLKLMYKLSQDAENVNDYRPHMVLRTAPKVKMKLDYTDKERV